MYPQSIVITIKGAEVLAYILQPHNKKRKLRKDTRLSRKFSTPEEALDYFTRLKHAAEEMNIIEND